MKNNFIAKNMNRVNHSSIHIDKKKEGISSDEDVQNGISEFIESFKNHIKEQNPEAYEEAVKLASKSPIKPRYKD